MLSRSTTFVLGAGASFDLKLPIGDGLQDTIAKSMAVSGQRLQNERLWRALTLRFHGDPSWKLKTDPLLAAARKIRDGLPVAASIDNFLHTHRGDPNAVLVGKVAIASAILEAEAASHLAANLTLPRLFERDGFKKSWYSAFMRMLTMGTSSDNPESLFSRTRFVIFNYDRCFELIVKKTFENYYGMDAATASKYLSKVEIIHPYGSVGMLESEKDGGVPFGRVDADLLAVSRGIKTFTESVNTEIVDAARRAIAEAETIVFLGFGFLPQNINLLTPKEGCAGSRIHATTYGISETDKLVVRKQLESFLRPSTTLELGVIQHVETNSTRSGFIDIENGTCRNLIENHRMRLTQ